MFSEGLSFFVFVLNDGALHLFRHVVELSLSVTMSRAAETRENLSMSRFDFLVLALQSSNCFDLNCFFFQNLLSSILPGYKVHLHLLHLWAVWFTVLFGLSLKCVFFSSEIFDLIPR